MLGQRISPQQGVFSCQIDFRLNDIMLKLKKIIQRRIFLGRLGGLVLGSIPFSLMACEAINLIHQVMQNFGAITRRIKAFV